MNINKVVIWKELKGDLSLKSILLQLLLFLIMDVIYFRSASQISVLKAVLYSVPISFCISIMMTIYRESHNNLECLFATSLTCKSILFGKAIYVTIKTAALIALNTMGALLYGYINHQNIVLLYDGVIVFLICTVFIFCLSYALCGGYWLVKLKYKKLCSLILCIIYYFISYLSTLETFHMTAVLFASTAAIGLFDLWLMKRMNAEDIIRRCSI